MFAYVAAFLVYIFGVLLRAKGGVKPGSFAALLFDICGAYVLIAGFGLEWYVAAGLLILVNTLNLALRRD